MQRKTKREEPKKAPTSQELYSSNEPIAQAFGCLIVCCIVTILAVSFKLLEPESFEDIISQQAFTTILSHDADVIPTLELANSIEKHSKRKLIVLVMEEISVDSLNLLKSKKIEVKVKKNINVQKFFKLDQKTIPDIHRSFEIARVWELTEYEKIVYITSNSVVVGNIDEIFGHESFGAVEDCCNWFDTGVMIISPSTNELQKLQAHLENYSIPEFAFDIEENIVAGNLLSSCNSRCCRATLS